MGKGRCLPCDYVWEWPGSTADDLGTAVCPTCSTVLTRTTKAAATTCTRGQVGLDG